MEGPVILSMVVRRLVLLSEPLSWHDRTNTPRRGRVDTLHRVPALHPEVKVCPYPLIPNLCYPKTKPQDMKQSSGNSDVAFLKLCPDLECL